MPMTQLVQTPVRAAPAVSPSAMPPAAPGAGFGFLFFLLVNVALFTGPADVIPDRLGLEIYQYVILTCLVFSFPAVLARLNPANIEQRPVDVCVLLLFPLIALSHLSSFRFESTWESCFEH